MNDTEIISTKMRSGIPQTQWLGLLGGGQLGAFFIQAAQALGFKVVVLTPEKETLATQIADRHICADYEDQEALDTLASIACAVTTEFENVPASSLRFLAQHCVTSPSADCVATAQNRQQEKEFINSQAHLTDVPSVNYHLIGNQSDLDLTPISLLPGILKTTQMGYDGKGQIRVKSMQELHAAYVEMGQVECILEQLVPLAYEISVLVARAADGQHVVYPVAENCHRSGILFTSIVPSFHLNEAIEQKAKSAASIIANALDYVGVLCIEFFVLEDGCLIINEMAPRPHNSAHYTLDTGFCSQFEQQVRCLTNMPLSTVSLSQHLKMLNILGDAWFDHDREEPLEPDWNRIEAIPHAVLHLYGKSDPRKGRKMGHITFVHADKKKVDEAFEEACKILRIAL
jgi:5-(carboxyamino)imidazole ribonucleotide synthase